MARTRKDGGTIDEENIMVGMEEGRGRTRG